MVGLLQCVGLKDQAHLHQLEHLVALLLRPLLAPLLQDKGLAHCLAAGLDVCLQPLAKPACAGVKRQVR